MTFGIFVFLHVHHYVLISCMFELPAEAVAVDHLFLSSAENISGPVCLRTTGYRLTIVL